MARSSSNNGLLRSTRMLYIDYDPMEFDEHVDELYPAKPVISVRVSKGQIGPKRNFSDPEVLPARQLNKLEYNELKNAGSQ